MSDSDYDPYTPQYSAQELLYCIECRSGFHQGFKEECIADGDTDFEWVTVHVNGVKDPLHTEVVWENGDDNPATLVVDIPDGKYLLSGVLDFFDEPIYMIVKDKKIDEEHLNRCAAFDDWRSTSPFPHGFLEWIAFDIEKKTVSVSSGS